MYISPPLKSFVAVDKQIPLQIQATVNFPDALVVALVFIISLCFQRYPTSSGDYLCHIYTPVLAQIQWIH